jgi:hypothetical protein
MNSKFEFRVQAIRFDGSYQPSGNTRLTTNFANLARGDAREENVRNTLVMIENRFNSLAHWDNPGADRYAIELDIISVELAVGINGTQDVFPILEMLQPTIFDRRSNKRVQGIVGNNLSSYVRDYDFSVLLPAYNHGRSTFCVPEDFGELHGNIFKRFLGCDAYQQRFNRLPVICISASSSQTYRRTGNEHPVLGIEYAQEQPSSTDIYFAKMGMKVRFFMPHNSAAPLAFYCCGDLLRDYTDLELIGTISTMETFQKIYRPEIYNANAQAASIFRPSLAHKDYSRTRIVYDREERSQLGLQQGRFAEQRLIKPYGEIIQQWASGSGP